MIIRPFASQPNIMEFHDPNEPSGYQPSNRSDTEGQLIELGLAPGDVSAIGDLIEDMLRPVANEMVVELITKVFQSIGPDNPAGCALRRALGFSGGPSFRRAAKDMLLSEDQLVTLHARIEARIGRPLGFNVAPPPPVERVLPAGDGHTGNCEPTSL